MSKKLIIIVSVSVVLLIIVLGAVGYFYFFKKSVSFNFFDQYKTTGQDIIDNATKGTLPSINTNPLENKPDVNPASAANPIKNIKTNPFE